MSKSNAPEWTQEIVEHVQNKIDQAQEEGQEAGVIMLLRKEISREGSQVKMNNSIIMHNVSTNDIIEFIHHLINQMAKDGRDKASLLAEITAQALFQKV